MSIYVIIKYKGVCGVWRGHKGAQFAKATGTPLPKPLKWQREFYDATGVFPYGWYECPVCGYRTCLLYTSGAYTGERDWDTLSKAYDRYPEVLCLHMADMLATHIMEAGE